MPRRLYLLVVAATLVGAFLRLWQLAEVPAGLHYDLAATALLGNDVAFHGYRPIFITAYTGHEVLFYYWLAAWFNLIGSSVFSLRLAAALVGILTLPAAFFALRQMARGWPLAGAEAALGVILLAVAFYHVTFSRFGFRVITQPLVQSLALGFLLRGWHRLAAGRRAGYRDLLLAGAFTGLAAYTYLSARFFPFPLAIFWLALLIGLARRPGAGRRQWALGGAAFLLSAGIVFAPLGQYFLAHPADFFNRAGQVLPRAGDETLLWQGLRRAAEMVFLTGETYARYNLPGLPLLVFPLGLFCLLGGALTLGRAFTAPTPLARAREWLLLAWLPALLLPTALAVREVFPSTIRALGVTPLLFVFPARGLLAAYRWLQRHAPGPLLPTAYPVTVVSLVILAAGAGFTYRDYFITWANIPTQRLDNDADLTGLAAFLNQQDLGGTTPYITSIHYRHPTLAYLARDYEALRWLTGGRSLVIPHEGAALVLEAASAPLPAEWTAGWDGHRIAQQLGPDNRPEYRVFRFAAGETPPLPEFQPLAENFGNAIVLTGARLLTDTEAVTADLRWRVENPVETGDFLPYVRLYDAAGRPWAQSADYTYPSEQWAAGDGLLTRLRIPLPAGLPPGGYTVKAGLYSEGTGASLPHLDARGGFGGERAVAGPVSLAGGPAASVEAFRAANGMTPIAQPLEGGLELLGYQLGAESLRPNERFELTLFWHARQPSQAPVEVRLGDQVLDTVSITVRDVLITRLTLRVPLAQPAGVAGLSVALPAGQVPLRALTVTPVERVFAKPGTRPVAGVAFAGGLIHLASTTLEPGAPTRLRLVWQAGPDLIGQDYTVFVHVQAADGRMAAQSDQPPQAGTYPTSLWAPHEFVIENYAFDLPPGQYTVAVGLYLAETGQRLTTAAGEDAVTVGAFNIP